ncbi:glycosyltransferase [Stieleria sp. TO1_6]|uniref:glycosyltransferase n=1 Tax=Stieleria tagensis TaxID=2956795 RepID=UPI00209B68A3|nr:glycosyltransferase [Stieleria tagensis]MCO8122525.1 glycosyltransferase [Stieleria tagensis]
MSAVPPDALPPSPPSPAGMPLSAGGPLWPAPTALAPLVWNPAPLVPIVLPVAQPPADVEKPSLPKLRVLHIVNGEHFSGAERVQSHLGRCLPDFSVDADFACVKPGKFAALLDQHQGQWGQIHCAAMAHRLDLRAAWKVRELVIGGGYQLLHAHTPRTAMIASVAAKLTGVPWVYHVHSPALRDSAKPITNRVNGAIERLALSSCSHLVTVSESLRLDCIRRGARESDVTVVHNGVPAIRPPRANTPVVGGRWVIGMVALMRARKGLEVMLDALAQLRSHHDVVLRLIGPFETESYEAEINLKIKRLDLSHCVERIGFSNQIPQELARLDAMVLPSLFGEGLPMVVLEAMAAGLPVIATRVEGTPEAVTDGVEGLLAEPRDAVSLAGKIEELVTGAHDWNKMSEAAFKRHGSDFSEIAMARHTAAIYRNVLNKPTP